MEDTEFQGFSNVDEIAQIFRIVNNTIGEVVWLSKDIQIVQVLVPSKNREHHDNREFYFMPVVNGKRVSQIAYDVEDAVLLALSRKYEGYNGQFAHYAVRMLGKDSNWS